VTWVPRVSRERKQVCGYQPTAVAGATSAAPQQAAPKVITLDQPSATAAARPAATSTARPAAAPAPKPQVRTVASPVPRTAPVATVRTTVRPVTVPTTRTTTARPTPVIVPVAPAAAPARVKPRAVAPAAASGGCSNASALSQRYINQTGVRCGPQAEPPITYGTRKSSSLKVGDTGVRVSLNTRVVPQHVYDKRQNTTNLQIPEGFRPVWTDDRLNPHRAERTLRPAIQYSRFQTPAGFRAVDREDDRLNPLRGMRTAEGDAQMEQLWSRDLPRTLLPVETNPRTITVEHSERSYTHGAKPPLRFRLSTRNAPATAPPAPTRARR